MEEATSLEEEEVVLGEAASSEEAEALAASAESAAAELTQDTSLDTVSSLLAAATPEVLSEVEALEVSSEVAAQ